MTPSFWQNDHSVSSTLNFSPLGISDCVYILHMHIYTLRVYLFPESVPLYQLAYFYILYSSLLQTMDFFLSYHLLYISYIVLCIFDFSFKFLSFYFQSLVSVSFWLVGFFSLFLFIWFLFLCYYLFSKKSFVAVSFWSCVVWDARCRSLSYSLLLHF